MANKAAVRNLSGHRMVETSESNDSQRYLKAKTAGEEKAKPWAEEPPGMGQQVRMTYVYV